MSPVAASHYDRSYFKLWNFLVLGGHGPISPEAWGAITHRLDSYKKPRPGRTAELPLPPGRKRRGMTCLSFEPHPAFHEDMQRLS